MTKVRLNNWVSKEAKTHLALKSKEKNISQATLLEVAINKIK